MMAQTRMSVRHGTIDINETKSNTPNAPRVLTVKARRTDSHTIQGLHHCPRWREERKNEEKRIIDLIH